MVSSGVSGGRRRWIARGATGTASTLRGSVRESWLRRAAAARGRAAAGAAWCRRPGHGVTEWRCAQADDAVGRHLRDAATPCRRLLPAGPARASRLMLRARRLSEAAAAAAAVEFARGRSHGRRAVLSADWTPACPAGSRWRSRLRDRRNGGGLQRAAGGRGGDAGGKVLGCAGARHVGLRCDRGAIGAAPARADAVATVRCGRRTAPWPTRWSDTGGAECQAASDSVTRAAGVTIWWQRKMMATRAGRCGCVPHARHVGRGL